MYLYIVVPEGFHYGLCNEIWLKSISISTCMEKCNLQNVLICKIFLLSSYKAGIFTFLQLY